MTEARAALSVVIPSRNTRELTLACLAALAAAAAARPELSALEVVLVDDAGDDGTGDAVAARHPQVRLLRLEHQAGFTRAANRGLAAAKGSVMLLLNSDTEVGGDGAGLAGLLERFAAEPRLGIAGAVLRYPDGAPQWSGGEEPTASWLFALASGVPDLLGRAPLYRRWRPASGTRGTGGKRGKDGPGGGGGEAGECAGRRPGAVAWVTGAAMAMRRAVWEQVGPLDESFRFYAQDLDFCLRARQAGWAVAVVPEFEVIHHHGATIQGEGGRRRGSRSGPAAPGRPGDGADLADPADLRTGASRGAVHPELLWTDLLRWAGKRGGAPAARRAARALLAGGRLRLLGRRLAAPLVPAAERARFREDSEAFGRALTAVAALAAAGAARETC
ncbi:MAG TPA: glycosyltransferase [Thermoanaerobaculia bacterium]|nr:glycosyltransferase [Thermoanaerobaculia bacterium]